MRLSLGPDRKRQQQQYSKAKRAFKRPRYSIAQEIGAVAHKQSFERKNFDSSLTLTTANASTLFSTLAVLNPIQQGPSPNERVGRKITMTKFQVRYTFDQIGAVGNFYPSVRVVLIYDRQNNGALPAIGDIFTSDGAAGVGFRSFQNLVNADRFLILADEYIQEKQQSYNSSYGGAIFRKDALQAVFNAGTAGTAADIQTGAIYLCFALGGNAIQVSATNTFRFYSRIRYTDA